MLASTAEVAQRADLLPLFVVVGYLGLLIGLGVLVKLRFRGTSSEYFVAGRSIGSFFLLMSLFGTTMTAFALVGSTGKAFDDGIGVYGLMASSSAVVHSLVFFLVGIRLWAIGKRHDFVTQIQFFRARFESNALGYLLFPILVILVMGYLLIGIAGAGVTVRGVTVGMFPETFPGVYSAALDKHVFVGAIPPWLTGLVICGVVLFYIFTGGVRGAVWANALQTIVFMITGLAAFALVSSQLGGLKAAARMVLENAPEHLAREGEIGHLQFLSYGLVPLSVGMFPHLFQHWLTARSAQSFKLSIVCHPLFIMVVWVPCVMIGIWAAGMGIVPPGGKSNAVLAGVVVQLVEQPFVSGLLMAGILAAIMSSLDSQFVCLGTMFTHDVVVHATGPERFTDGQRVAIGRGFIVLIVAAVYGLSLLPQPRIFDLGVWCFSGFSSLFPLVFAALYWRRVTRAGAVASVLVMIVVWFAFFYRGLLVPLSSGALPEGDYLVAGVMPVTFIFAASAATLVLVSLLTSPPPKQVVDRFFIPK